MRRTISGRHGTSENPLASSISANLPLARANERRFTPDIRILAEKRKARLSLDPFDVFLRIGRQLVELGYSLDELLVFLARYGASAVFRVRCGRGFFVAAYASLIARHAER
jgi:hypothetical protein